MNSIDSGAERDSIQILIVDDDENFGPMLQTSVQEFFNMNAALSKTSSEAYTQIDSSTFSLILLDWNLEGDGTGLPILKHVKEKFPQTPVVVMSGQNVTNNIDVQEAAILNDADAFFLKPFKLSVWGKMIINLVDLYRSAGEWFPLRSEKDIISCKAVRKLYVDSALECLKGWKLSDIAERLEISPNTLNAIIREEADDN